MNDQSQNTTDPGAGARPPGPASGGQTGESLIGVSLRVAKRIVIGMIGGTVVLIGVAMVVLPGPAVVVIPLGLAILATEFVFARHWLRKLKGMIPGMKADGTGVKAAAAGAPPEQPRAGKKDATSP